jgi:hypothetical protein
MGVMKAPEGTAAISSMPSSFELFPANEVVHASWLPLGPGQVPWMIVNLEMDIKQWYFHSNGTRFFGSIQRIS